MTSTDPGPVRPTRQRKAIAEVFTEAVWQRCYVHFLRNALDYLPRKAANDCLTELRWIYDRRNIDEARQDLPAWLKKWSNRYPKLCDWVETNIEETLTAMRRPYGQRPVVRFSDPARWPCAGA